MYLETVKQPTDVKKLEEEQRRELAEEMRAVWQRQGM